MAHELGEPNICPVSLDLILPVWSRSAVNFCPCGLKIKSKRLTQILKIRIQDFLSQKYI